VVASDRATEHNLETDERSNLAIQSDTRAARVDKIRARNHLAHTWGGSGAGSDQYLVHHELRKRIYKRFRDEGIEFPVPQRNVHVSSNPSNEIPFPTFRSKDLL